MLFWLLINDLVFSFMIEAWRLFHRKEFRRYSRELRVLRECVKHHIGSQIGYVDYSTDHYCSYVVNAFHFSQHGDSMDPRVSVVQTLDLARIPQHLTETGIIDHQGRGGEAARLRHTILQLEKWPSPCNDGRRWTFGIVCCVNYVSTITSHQTWRRRVC